VIDKVRVRKTAKESIILKILKLCLSVLSYSVQYYVGLFLADKFYHFSVVLLGGEHYLASRFPTMQRQQCFSNQEILRPTEGLPKASEPHNLLNPLQSPSFACALRLLKHSNAAQRTLRENFCFSCNVCDLMQCAKQEPLRVLGLARKTTV
jgi:hypothetical protein